MAPEKDALFFSHSTKDADILVPLKEAFLEKIGGTLDVFVSSDGQSIKFGSNWSASIETALRRAKLMFVFVSPNSIDSHWIHFEAGFAYSKGIQVVPIAFRGIKIEQVRPPLSLLQGHNLYSVDQLNNLIAITNDVFDHQHKYLFTEQDYIRMLAKEQDKESYGVLGRIREIEFTIIKADLSVSPSITALSKAKEIFERNNIEILWETGKSLTSRGIEIINTQDGALWFRIVPSYLFKIIHVVNEVISEIRLKKAEGLVWNLDFPFNTFRILTFTEVAAQLADSSVKFGQAGLVFEDITFSWASFVSQSRHGYNSSIKLIFSTPVISCKSIRDLLRILFEYDCIVPVN